MILRTQIFLADEDIIHPFMGKRFDFHGIDVPVHIDTLSLFGKYHRRIIKILGCNTGDGDAGGLDRDDFIDGPVRKKAFKFLSHLLEQ